MGDGLTAQKRERRQWGLCACRCVRVCQQRKTDSHGCEQRGQEDKGEWGRAEGDDQAKTSTVFVCRRLSCDPCFMTWAT